MTHSDKAALRGEPSYVWRSGQERRLNMARELVNLEGQILDNGCGLGTYLDAFGRFSTQRFGIELEADRAEKAGLVSEGVAVSVGETLPFTSDTFDTVFSNEVIEHVQDDRLYMSEISRVLKKNGRCLIFCPNRWYPVEQHGIYWRGTYKFGNIPLVNYLPMPLRNKLAPHVKVYTKRNLIGLTDGLPLKVVHHSCIFGGYDNIEYRLPTVGKRLKQGLYALEKTPFSVFGLSHLLVLEKT